MNNYKVSTSYIRFKGRDYTDTWLSKDGIKISNIEDGEDEMAVFGDIEEYRTVGTGFKEKSTTETKFGSTGDFQEKDDITENMIRQDHNLDFRATYLSVMFNNLTKEEEQQQELKMKKIREEMERGR